MSSFSNWTYRSNSDMFFCADLNPEQSKSYVTGDELRHLARVMKYHAGDSIYVTNGAGAVSFCKINSINSKAAELSVLESYHAPEKFPRIVFCLPFLKNPDRMEFAFEKLIEMGFHRFIFFKSERAVKKSLNKERLEKIGLHAMTQSLNAWKPEITVANDLFPSGSEDEKWIVFEQEAASNLQQLSLAAGITYYFVFGPEGGLSEGEINRFANAGETVRLLNQRLRSETAILYAGTAVSLQFSI